MGGRRCPVPWWRSPTSGRGAHFTAPSVGAANAALEFELTVKDNDGLLHSDTVLVNVSNINIAPFAHAGDDQNRGGGHVVGGPQRRKSLTTKMGP